MSEKSTDWAAILGDSLVRVNWYSMSEAEDLQIDSTVAELRMRDGFYIDVSWYQNEGRYFGRLYDDYFENLAAPELSCKSSDGIVSMVRDLAALIPVRRDG